MWSERQSWLIDQLCTASHLQDQAAHIKAHEALLVDGVAVNLLPGLTAESICVITQLGHPAKNLELAAYKKLLELNLVIDQGNHQRMAIDPSTGAALFLFEIDAGDVSKVLISLQRAAACAKTWQEDHFIEIQHIEEAA
ncbi:MAG: CesT family type III secretion system chaperone [Oxalobacteraceae bacterium]